MAAAIPGPNTLSVQTAGGRAFLSGGEIQDLPTKGMQAWRQIGAAERKPDKLERKPEDFGRGQPPQGMMVCRAYVRAFENGRSSLVRHRRQSEVYSGPQRDFLWLTSADAESLLPPDRAAGTRYPLPRPVADRIVRHYLFDVSMGCGMSKQRWRPEDWREGEITLVVEETTAKHIRLRLEGRVRLASDAAVAQAATRGGFQLLGFLGYDPSKKAFDRFDIVALGRFHDDHGAFEKDLTLGIAFELAAPDSLGYGVPPVMIRDGEPGQFQNYFGTEHVPGVREYFQRKQ